jgi:hypothetical protein
MDNQHWFYVRDGKISQSVDAQELNRLYQQNYLDGDILLCKVGDGNWQKFRDVFNANDAPPVPMRSLQHEYAVIISVSPLIAMYFVRYLIPTLMEFKIDLSALSYSITIFFWASIQGWCIGGDENYVKNGIMNFPDKFKLINLIPFVYLIRRYLRLRRIYLASDWMSLMLLVVNVISFAYVFGY